MTAAGPKSLKAQNVAWLWSTVVLDVVLLLAFQYLNGSAPAISAAQVARYFGLRAILTAAAPVLVLLLTGVLPSDFKASLVYWRWRDVLPSHRAFTLHAGRDSRINLESLRRNTGDFPERPRDQSSHWYKLYKVVETETTVSDAHRHFLLFRDLAALSFVLCLAAPTLFYFIDRNLLVPSFGLFVVQYLVSAIAARNHGTRMVGNVLALHSGKRRR